VPDFGVAPGFEFPTNIEFPPDLDFQAGFDLSLNFGTLNTAGSSSTLPTPAVTSQPEAYGSWTDSSDENAEYDNFAVEGQEPDDDGDYNALADTTIRPSYQPAPRSANNFDLASGPILPPALMNLPSSAHPRPVFPTAMPQPTVGAGQLTTAPGALPQNRTEMLELQRRLEIPTHLVSNFLCL
jgi:hypothetical protein